jgi:hypothetical protein
MKNTKEITLMKGEYSSDEAREILFNMFSNKINFHQMKNFSSQERFGKESKTALKRIAQLKKSMLVASKILDKAKKNNETLEILSEVKITFFKVKKNSV